MIKFLSIIFLFIVPLVFHAQDGTLDHNFGQNGIRYYNHFNANSEIRSMIRTGDYLFAAGYTKQGTKEEFSIFKLDLDGEPVSDFGTDGLKIFSNGTGFGRADVIIEQADGKLVACGWIRVSNKDLYTLIRIYPDGSLDSTFGGDGIVMGSFSTSSYAEDEIYDARMLSDGRIIVVGRSYNGQNDDGFLGCIDEYGNPCSGFGNNGVHIIKFSEGIGVERARAVAIDAAENIYVGGSVKLSHSTEASFFILKFDHQGVPDNNFGNSGKVIHTVADNIDAGINVLEIDHSGRILTGGGAFNTDELDNDYFMTRYSGDGVLDTDFGDQGVLIIPRNDNESISDLLVLPNDDVLAAGSTGGFPSQMSIMRIKSSGDPDLNFGQQGWALASAANGFNGIESITLDENGDIYAGGHTYISSVFHMAIAKFNSTLTSLPPALINNLSLSLSPNPANNICVLQFDLPEKSKFSLALIDYTGRMINVLEHPGLLLPGKHLFTFDLSKYPSGNYFAFFQFDEHSGALPIVKN